MGNRQCDRITAPSADDKDRHGAIVLSGYLLRRICTLREVPSELSLSTITRHFGKVYDPYLAHIRTLKSSARPRTVWDLMQRPQTRHQLQRSKPWLGPPKTLPAQQR